MKKDILRNKPNNKKHILRNKPNNKKHIKTILVSIIFILIIGYIGSYMLVNTSKIDTSVNYEQVLFENADMVACDGNPTVTSVSFDPHLVENGAFSIQLQDYVKPEVILGGYQIKYGQDADENEMNSQTTFEEFSRTQLKVIESAKSHVIKYIQDSKVLENKEYLIEKIQEVPFYLYTETTNERLLECIDGPAACFEHGIYCNIEFEQYFAEFMFTHELFHYLRYLTSGSVLNEYYYGSSLDEAIADVLAESTGAIIPKRMRIESGYKQYYNMTYNYLQIFREDALKAYFYGYDEFFEKYGGNTFKTEHDCFVVTMAFYGQSYDSYPVAQGLFSCWNARYHER